MKKKYTIFEWISTISNQLYEEFSDVVLVQNYAWLLMKLICNSSKAGLIARGDLFLTIAQERQLKQFIDDLVIKKKPLDYIIGSVSFCNIEIFVAPPTLIPRPETEEWVTDLINQLKKLSNQKIIILDLATGSGCIGLALAYHLPEALVIATDISDSALLLARKNSVYNTINNIVFIKSNLFDALREQYYFDIIVSNPPYIAESERDTLDRSVLEWEDEKALFAEDNGLAIIKQIVVQAPTLISHNDEIKKHNIAQLMVEIGYMQGQQVLQLMKDAGYSYISVYKDLAQKDRVVGGRVDDVANAKD